MREYIILAVIVTVISVVVCHFVIDMIVDAIVIMFEGLFALTPPPSPVE